MAGFFAKFFGRTISEAAGYGIGGAIEKPLEPGLQELTNETWRAGVALGATVPLDASDAAEIVAEDVQLEAWGADQAAQAGIGSDQFAALVQATLNAPGFGELLRILRRHPEALAEFEHGLRKNRLETRWDPHLTELKDDRLQPAVIALAIVRGIMADPGFLPVGPPTTEGKVRAFPTSPLDPLIEAAAAGIDSDRLFVETAVAGRPPGPVEAAQAAFRGIIEDVDFKRAIAEGDVRNEWADALFEVARQIPTTHDFVEMRLRGWYQTDQQMYDGAARHGMNPADVDVLHLIAGRPIAPHRVFIGERRGGQYNVTPADIDPAFLKAQQESNQRPEWYGLDWAARFAKPSIFFVRQWLKDGHDPAQAQTWLWEEGWEQSDIDKFITAYSPKAVAATDKHVTSSTTSLVTAARKAYVGRSANEQQARDALTAAGIAAATQDALIALWNAQRTLEQLPAPPAA